MSQTALPHASTSPRGSRRRSVPAQQLHLFRPRGRGRRTERRQSRQVRSFRARELPESQQHHQHPQGVRTPDNPRGGVHAVDGFRSHRPFDRQRDEPVRGGLRDARHKRRTVPRGVRRRGGRRSRVGRDQRLAGRQAQDNAGDRNSDHAQPVQGRCAAARAGRRFGHQVRGRIVHAWLVQRLRQRRRPVRTSDGLLGRRPRHRGSDRGTKPHAAREICRRHRRQSDCREAVGHQDRTGSSFCSM